MSRPEKGCEFSARYVLLGAQARLTENLRQAERNAPEKLPQTTQNDREKPLQKNFRRRITFACGKIYARFEYPIKNLSTAFATLLPSLIAHTTSDCPRCMSPATNTFSTLVL